VRLSRPARLVAVVALLVVAYRVAIATDQLRPTGFRIDLAVYRLGADVWRTGGNLYGRLPTTSLPFTYPPIAAVLLVPLTWVPLWFASVLVTVVSVGALSLAVRSVLGSTGWRPRGSELAAVVAFAVLLEPVRETLRLGQVNLVLLALVVADCLVDRPWWPRGSLVGLAAAFKLTPLVFVPYLAARHGPRPARTAVLTAVAVTVAGALLAPADSWRYWTGVVFDTRRIGSPWYAGNQSLRSVVERAGLHGPAGTTAWLVGCAAVGALAVVAVRAALRAGRPALGLALTGVAGLLVSPVSWSHHWVWVVALVPAMWSVGTRSARTLSAVTAAVMLAGPQWWLPHGANRELAWTPVQQLLGSSYVVLGVTALGWAALALTAAPGSLATAWRTGLSAGARRRRRSRSSTA
jgi:alpha-1,2-mannosyltransferase